mmetsp:Transcript_12034/g.17986  ORF Transcript_12034/g.17986 Transcript_12034/m.17986 type:complete len:225 (+) Transcript_12034:48-722(+)
MTDFNYKIAAIVPSVCFFVILIFHFYEFKRDDSVRALFKKVRVGWINENYLKGGPAVNTTRDYVRATMFMGRTAIVLAGLITGIAADRNETCRKSSDGCNDHDTLLFVKIGVLVILLVGIFFVYSMCSRYITHVGFMINTKHVEGVPFPMDLIYKMLHQAHRFYSIGMRMFFLCIPLFGWIFGEWVLVAITPVYLYLIHDMETSDFTEGGIEQLYAAIESHKSS